MAIRKVISIHAKPLVRVILCLGLIGWSVYWIIGKEMLPGNPKKAPRTDGPVLSDIAPKPEKPSIIEKAAVTLTITGIRNRTKRVEQIVASRFIPADGAEAFGFSLAMSENYAIAGERRHGTLYFFKLQNDDLIFQNKLMPDKTFHGRMAIDMTDDHAVVGCPDAGRPRPVTESDFKNLRVRNRKSLELTTDEIRSLRAHLFVEPGQIIERLKARGYLDVHHRITQKFHGCTPGFEENMTGFTKDQCRLIGHVLENIKDRQETGVVYVLRNNGSKWEKQEEWILDDATPATHFGASVAVSDMYALVSSNRRQFRSRKYREGIFDLEKPVTKVCGESPAVFIYRKSKDSWLPHQEIAVPGQCGAVDIAGDYAIVGGFLPVAPPGDGMFVERVGMWVAYPGFGLIHVLKQNGDEWRKKTSFTAADNGIPDRENFGAKLLMNSSQVVAVTEDGFHLLDYKTQGARTRKNLSPGFFCNTGFFRDASLSLSDNVALAGMEKEGKTGAVFLFQKNAPGWHGAERICPNDTAADGPNIRFGSAVATNGDYGLAGAPGTFNASDKNRGAIYFFRISQR